MLNSFNVGKPNPLFILIFPLLTKWAREIEFAPRREGRSVKGHREFPKWRFWEIFGKCKPFLGFWVIAGILPFVKDDKKRSEVITQISEESGITKKTIRKYLCEYLASQSVVCFAPTKREKRPLTKDEKNMRKALNKYYYTMRKNSLKTVYTMMLKNSYCDDEGKLVEE